MGTLPITRRPGEPHYRIAEGGNTVLRILKDLYEKTQDPRFHTIQCLFEPWVSENETLIAHLVENERETISSSSIGRALSGSSGTTGTLNPRPVYQGIPNIAVIGSDGQFHTLNGRTQWRLLHQQGPWQEGERGCRGRVWLRLIDADNGLERLRRQLDVAPKSLQMQQVIGTLELRKSG